MSEARRKQDWDGQYELAIDPTVARGRRGEAPPADESVCSMCGEFCAIKVQNDAKEAKAAKTAKN